MSDRTTSREAGGARRAPEEDPTVLPTLLGPRAAGEQPGSRLGPDLVILVIALVAVAFLWGRARHTWFWLDEGIAVGISSYPLTEIPGLLRLDGSPPLYYLLLHGWTSVLGSSEAATHLLSLLFALAVVPAALWAGWSLFGRRAGWTCAVLATVNPFIAYYSNETRMYSLAVLLSLLATATFLHAFVLGRRRYVPAFVILLALLLYTHNWGLLVALGAGVALIACAVAGNDRRRILLDGAIAFAAVGLLYAPWVPVLLYQKANGDPFAPSPTLLVVRDELIALLGPRDAVVALGVGAAGSFIALLRPPLTRTSVAVGSAVLVAVVAVASGWAASSDGSVWVFRYLAVVLGPILLVLAGSLARGGQIALAGLSVYALLVAPIGVKTPPFRKSNVKAVAQAASDHLRPGDLVITDFGRTPVLHYYLPPGLDYAETTGPVADERVSDQRHGIRRLLELDPRVTLAPLIDRLAVGGRVLVVCPPPTAKLPDDALFVFLSQRRCDEARAAVAGDPRFRLDLSVEPPSGVVDPVNGYVLTKLAQQ